MPRGKSSWAREPPRPKCDEVYAKELKDFRNGTLAAMSDDEICHGFVVIPTRLHGVMLRPSSLEKYRQLGEIYKVVTSCDPEIPGVLVVKGLNTSSVNYFMADVAEYHNMLSRIEKEQSTEVYCYPFAESLSDSQKIEFMADEKTGAVRPRLSPVVAGMDQDAAIAILSKSLEGIVNLEIHKLISHLGPARLRIDIGTMGFPNCPIGTQLKVAGFESLLRNRSKMVQSTFERVHGSRSHYQRIYSALHRYWEQSAQAEGRDENMLSPGVVKTTTEVCLITKSGMKLPFSFIERSDGSTFINRVTIATDYLCSKNIRVGCFDQSSDFEIAFEYSHYDGRVEPYEKMLDELKNRVEIIGHPNNIHGRFEVKLKGQGPLKTQIVGTEVVTISEFDCGSDYYTMLVLREFWKGFGTSSSMETETTISVCGRRWRNCLFVQGTDVIDPTIVFYETPIKKGLEDCIKVVRCVQKIIAEA